MADSSPSDPAREKNEPLLSQYVDGPFVKPQGSLCFYRYY